MYSIKGDPDNPTFKDIIFKLYSQTHCINYFETFSPTTRTESIRILKQLAVNYGLIVPQIDVKSGYFNAQIDCDIYVCQPKVYEVLNEKGKPMAIKLKQSVRNWSNLLCNNLCDIGFTKSNANSCTFYKK